MLTTGNRLAVANWYNVDTLTSSPPQVNFLLYSTLHSILSIAYIEGSYRFFPRCKWSSGGLTERGARRR